MSENKSKSHGIYRNKYRYYETKTNIVWFRSLYRIDHKAKKIYVYNDSRANDLRWQKVKIHGLKNYENVKDNIETNFKHLTEEEVFLKLL